MRCIKKRIRTRKEDSALLYAILESHSGMTLYSTVNYQPGALHRDLELLYAPGFEEDVECLLKSLGEWVHEQPLDDK